MGKKYDNSKFIGIRSGLLLAVVSYALYNILWVLLDDESLGQTSLEEYVIDFFTCIIFTYTTLGFAYLIFKILPLRTSFTWGILYSSILLVLNNLVAVGMIWAFECIWGDMGESVSDKLIEIKGVYAYVTIATFVSSVYANTFYLRTYLNIYEEKRKLEMDLIREKEIALQSQLNSLKLQINPHFLFNNFSTLSDLIETDRAAAAMFLKNLSKVYRYILQNLSRNLIRVAEETEFLEHYASLMKIRHGDGIIIEIDKRLKACDGKIPPASMQLLVENAIKHNGYTKDCPLFIEVGLTDRHVFVRNIKTPLISTIKSTGIGQQNITDRYSLLSSEKVEIENSEHYYSVKLPLIRTDEK